MPALENSSELERIARCETSQIPYPDAFGKARALDYWMRSHIQVDWGKAHHIRAGGTVDCYRNSLETFYDTKGVCGEQAYLYIILCRNAGLDARFVLSNDGTHALTGIYTPCRRIYVDHVTPRGFDCRIPAGHYRELHDDQVESLYEHLNHRRPLPAPFVEPERWLEPGPAPYPPCPPRVVPAWEAQAFLVAACFIIPWVMSFSQHFEALRNLTNPILALEQARPYIQEAGRLASARYGPRAQEALELLKQGYDLNGDRVLDRNEAYALYQQVAKETKD